MKIVFMGTPDFAIPSLRVLVENGYEIAGVITAPDKPTGRGQKVRMTPVKTYAVSQGLTVLQPEKLRDPEFLAELSGLGADLFVVVAFRMLPEVVWSMPPLGTFNLHASLLPDYRGAAPINWAIINGETKTGATTFFIEKKIDTGNILLQREIAIPSEWTAGDLHDALMEMGGELVLKTVKMIEAGTAQPVPQDHSKFQHPAPKIFKEDCRIDWDQPLETVRNFIRGLSPYPTAWTTLEDLSLKIFDTEIADPGSAPEPGKLHLEGKNDLLVGTADGWLKINTLQLQGKKKMDTASFLNGYKGELTYVR